MSWLDSVAERRFMVALGLVGLVASGYVLYAARQAWRKAAGQRARNRPKPTRPRYSGAGETCAALGVGALKAVAAREPVDVHAYRCPARSIRARFREEFGGDDARENYPRAVRALLGSQAEVVAPGLRLVEEALRQRVRVGGELWAHALEEYATARGLPFAERETLLSVATQIASAEDRMRLDGILREGDRIPSLLARHWAEGVDLVRAGLRTRWLSEHEGREYLDRAGELAAKWYQDWPTLFGALLLPAYLADDVREAEWGAAVGRQLLTDARSPLRVPLGPVSMR
ncbi:DUF1266 domain-containing protein [Amycolatopsis acidicola]|uniref:DUF1266 domain-containing protein n=1 Tax=Amycolatopsis acidicola TaxID=2596893 RepID=A0A5N0VA91_9PSEU|nr:DUF1266 domain-containing protein [Amycolatopsis acidicola]KAA9161891.1 DUF1266 domain-containing protein [Amycolatopsis acidicola]